MGSTTPSARQALWMAPIGQKPTHFLHLMHLSMSTTGAENPFCVNAPAGHTLIDGHGWFCGHRV